MKIHHQRTPFLALSPLALSLAMASAHAATRTDLHSLDLGRLNAAYRNATQATGPAASTAQRHAELMGLDAESGLSLQRTYRDFDGTKHYRYQQTFRGVPIWGEGVVASDDPSGSAVHLFGNALDGLAGDLGRMSVKLTSAQALAVAKSAALGAKVSTYRTQREDAAQYIVIDENGNARMAHVVSFFADTAAGTPTRPFVIVDSNTGAILAQWDGLTTSQIGTGPGGNQKTGQHEWGSGGIFGFLDVAQSGTTCTMNNSAVKTVNLNGGTSGTIAFTYPCPRNTVKTINGAFSPLNDAHFFGGVIQNMYNAYLGVNALTFQLVMRTHYSSNFENAFWDGAQMSFGDGASTFYPLVSADVAGHEVSHGFTEQHSNLVYKGQSGGMNEAFSDMGGEATEFFWKGTNDFLVGQEIFKSTSGALRYLCNPTQDGKSIDNAANFTSSLDVHYSSGVYNKAFCTLAKAPNWGTAKAFKVFARANQLYWTASSTFNSGACGVETAATDLGFAKSDVTTAFNGVGVSCSGGGGGGGGGTTPIVLTKAVAVTNQATTTGKSLNYSLEVPAGASNLTFNMSGGTGDADLYVKLGSTPTDTAYDCRPFQTGNTESCTFAAPTPGTYFVRLKAFSSFSGVSLVGNYSTGSGGGSSSQLLLNPGFESGSLAWTGTSGVITNSASRTPQAGSFYAWLGGNGVTSTETMAQSVAIPAGKASAILSFYLKVDSAENSTQTAFDTMSVSVLNSAGTTSLKTCATYSNLNKSMSYAQKTCDLSAFAGQTVTIRFNATEDSSLQTSFLIDDTALNVQ